jgi:hypothetical protein
VLALGVTCIIYASPFSNSRDVPDMFSKVECTGSSPPAPPAPLSSCRGLTGRCSASLRSGKRSGNIHIRVHTINEEGEVTNN